MTREGGRLRGRERGGTALAEARLPHASVIPCVGIAVDVGLTLSVALGGGGEGRLEDLDLHPQRGQLACAGVAHGRVRGPLLRGLVADRIPRLLRGGEPARQVLDHRVLL